MKLYFRLAQADELPHALSMLKEAAENLKAKGINQWQFWLDPTPEKIEWVREGFLNNEFHFVENEQREVVGMFRLQLEDELYWGKQERASGYIHSLVVRKKFAGKDIGSRILEYAQQVLRNEGIFSLRLDCNAQNKVLCDYYIRQGFKKLFEKQTQFTLNAFFEKEFI